MLHAWKYTPEDLAGRLLFHGSCERWTRPQPITGMDSCFWTAPGSPLVAQTYISRSGGQALVTLHNSSMEQLVPPAPHSVGWAIATRLGAKAENVELEYGMPKRWTVAGNPIRYRDVKVYLESLGYTVNSGEPIWVNTVTDPDSHESIVLPKAGRTHGRLIMIELDEGCRIFNMAHEEGDLSDPQHLAITTFTKAFEAGYDAVQINDFCQSPSYGNVGHLAIGLSQQAVDRLHKQGKMISIAAGHDDFDAYGGISANPHGLTQDFLRWHVGVVAQALVHGKPVPPGVIEWHSQALEELINGNENVSIQVGLDPHCIRQDDLGASKADELLINELILKIHSGWTPGPDYSFVMDRDGRIAPSNPDDPLALALTRAVIQSKTMVPVQAKVLNSLGRPATANDLSYAMAYWRNPPAAYPKSVG